MLAEGVFMMSMSQLVKLNVFSARQSSPRSIEISRSIQKLQSFARRFKACSSGQAAHQVLFRQANNSQYRTLCVLQSLHFACSDRELEWFQEEKGQVGHVVFPILFRFSMVLKGFHKYASRSRRKGLSDEVPSILIQ